MPTTLHTFQSEEDQKFEEEFVYIDTGPDGDGYDAELPVWNDYFKSKTDFEKIEIIKTYLHSRDQRLIEQFVEKVEDRIMELNEESNRIYNENLTKDNELSNDHAMAIAIHNKVMSEVSAAQTAFISN